MDALSHLIHLKKYTSPSKHRASKTQQDASLPLAFLSAEQTEVIQILQMLFTVP